MEQTVAELKSDLRAMERSITYLNGQVDTLAAAVRELNDTVQKAKGALVVISVVASCMGAVASWFSHK